jgi:hypothetical protein
LANWVSSEKGTEEIVEATGKLAFRMITGELRSAGVDLSSPVAF